MLKIEGNGDGEGEGGDDTATGCTTDEKVYTGEVDGSPSWMCDGEKYAYINLKWNKCINNQWASSFDETCPEDNEIKCSINDNGCTDENGKVSLRPTCLYKFGATMLYVAVNRYACVDDLCTQGNYLCPPTVLSHGSITTLGGPFNVGLCGWAGRDYLGYCAPGVKVVECTSGNNQCTDFSGTYTGDYSCKKYGSYAGLMTCQ